MSLSTNYGLLSAICMWIALPLNSI